MKKHTFTEYIVAVVAIAIWIAFYIASLFLGTETYPIGYFQKLPFGIMSICIIYSVIFIILKYSHPRAFDLLDPDTDGGINNLTEWQQIKVALFWAALIGFGAVYLVANY